MSTLSTTPRADTETRPYGSLPFSSDGIVRKRLRAAWLIVGARGGCVSVSAAIEMADMAEELVTIPPSLPSLRSLPVFASLALGGASA